MRKFFLLPFLFIGFNIHAQIVGQWTTIDDNTGKPKSIVEITVRNNKYYGKVIKLLNPSKPNPVCDQCAKDDARYNQKVLGMEILVDLVKDDDEFVDGRILDPENGKVYRCKIWIEDGDLKLRGYLGPFFRTQTWKKSVSN